MLALKRICFPVHESLLGFVGLSDGFVKRREEYIRMLSCLWLQGHAVKIQCINRLERSLAGTYAVDCIGQLGCY